MFVIYDKVVTARDNARAVKDIAKLSTYQVILGEVQRAIRPEVDGSVKKYPDASIVSVLKTLRSGWKDNPQVSEDDIKILDQYIPSQLSKYDMEQLIEIEKPSNIGSWMKYLKDNYAGQFDGKLAKEVFDAS